MSTIPTTRREAACRSGEHGLVSVELALATLAVLILLAMVFWGVVLIMVQMACTDTAAAVARQAARGDRAGVAAAEAAGPQQATVHITHSPGSIRVAVRVKVAPPGGLLPPVTLGATATAVPEPGVGR